MLDVLPVDVGWNCLRPAVRSLAAVGEAVCGTGRLPKAGPAGVGWLGSPTIFEGIFGPERPRDPWGRCYLANLGGLESSTPVLVLSAGPKALIDTSTGARAPQGGGVGIRVW